MPVPPHARTQVASLNTTRLLLAALLQEDDSKGGQPPLSLVVQIGDLSYAQVRGWVGGVGGVNIDHTSITQH